MPLKKDSSLGLGEARVETGRNQLRKTSETGGNLYSLQSFYT